ncbi:MAG: hypothetical protein MJ041_00800 [Acidaminococcaceae bacterium]|nr:hypothetical protein [Acidaminococcaceae bacterium]
MTVDEALTQSLLLFMQKGKGNGLEYVSRSHTAGMGWYYWLHGVPGVYEIELNELYKEGKEAKFYLRYYPDTEEEVLENYSVQEQILRFNDQFFNDNAIREEDHEICPCCTVPDMEHLHGDGEGCHHHHHKAETNRKVGIPILAEKFNMNKKLYTIGMLCVNTEDEAVKLYLDTMERLVEISEKGIRFTLNGQDVELVPPGGIDRNVPGMELGKRFVSFLQEKLIPVLNEM